MGSIASSSKTVELSFPAGTTQPTGRRGAPSGPGSVWTAGVRSCTGYQERAWQSLGGLPCSCMIHFKRTAVMPGGQSFICMPVQGVFRSPYARTVEASVSSNLETSMGFAKCPFMPAAKAFFLSSSKAFAVRATMGIPDLVLSAIPLMVLVAS